MKIVEQFKYEEITGFKFGALFIGQPKLFSHIYFVDGLLIDTGQRKMQQEIVEETKNLGVNQIYITHHHEDHSGNIASLQSLFNCTVFAPNLCCEIMKSPPKLSLAQRLIWGNRPSYSDLHPKMEFIKTEHYNFRIIPIPGHAIDMVALYEEDKGWLFSADLFINTYIGYFLENENIFDQIQSLKKILKLEFSVMLCSHNPQFEKPKQKLEEKLKFLESFFSDVEMLYRKGASPTKIFKSLRLRENWIVKFISGGQLSKLNMVQSVIRCIEQGQSLA